MVQNIPIDDESANFKEELTNLFNSKSVTNEKDEKI